MTILARFISTAAALWLFALPGAQAGEPEQTKIAVFRFELIDTSGGPPRGENERLDLITDILRRKLDESDRYELVDMARIGDLEDRRLAEMAAGGYLRDCNGCEAEIAALLGADLSVAGTVQKVSNLILNINVYMRDAATGEPVETHSVDIRGNTDQTWSHGISWMIRHRLLE
jgi:hypothetical protein